MSTPFLAGRYRLIELVGRGGMAEVWRGKDVRLGRPVAVKLIISVRGDRADAADEVWREARDAARLVHPNVVDVYDVGGDRGRMFIVMEWMAGRDLATVLRQRGPFPAAQVAWIGAQAARALAAAHAAGIVHRDVKPANLMLTGGNAGRAGSVGVVKLTDFGIAAPAEPESGAGFDEGPLLGTTAYISPEQVLGQPAGPASDLYALGCALYELLIGSPPFTGEDAAQVVRQHLARDPIPPGRLRADVPEPLERLILRLLTKEQASRPADAREVAQTLESITSLSTIDRSVGPPRAGAAEAAPGQSASGPPGAPGSPSRPPPTARMTGPLPPSPASPAGSGSRRRRAVTIAAPILVVAMLAAALAIVAWADSPHPRTRSPGLAAPTPAPPARTSPRPSQPNNAPGQAPERITRMTKPKSRHTKAHHPATDRPKDHDGRHGKGHH